MIKVELSGVITMPFGKARSPATWRADPSGRRSAMIPDVGFAPARNWKAMLFR
jgi:hypothetical protein